MWVNKDSQFQPKQTTTTNRWRQSFHGNRRTSSLFNIKPTQPTPPRPHTPLPPPHSRHHRQRQRHRSNWTDVVTASTSSSLSMTLISITKVPLTKATTVNRVFICYICLFSSPRFLCLPLALLSIHAVPCQEDCRSVGDEEASSYQRPRVSSLRLLLSRHNHPPSTPSNPVPNPTTITFTVNPQAVVGCLLYSLLYQPCSR